MSKNYLGISRDHSGSMSSITAGAARDYNAIIAAVQTAALEQNQDTIVSVVRCGSMDTRAPVVEREVVNSSVAALSPMAENSYRAMASGTPLWDSVGELIELFEAAPDAADPDVTFLIAVITDGEENASKKWTARQLAAKITQLQATDRWTFTFRVPRGYGKRFSQYGFAEGNILEWDTTSKGIAVATQATTQALSTYYSGLSRGIKSTNKFYTNIAEVSQAEVVSALVDISSEVSLWEVQADSAIRPFVESVTGGPMIRGSAFYQLTKTEDEVQDYKQIAIRDRTTGHIYTGAPARQMLALPTFGTVRVAPGDHGNYDIYIQSTSVNRKLPAGTKVLIWPNAGVMK